MKKEDKHEVIIEPGQDSMDAFVDMVARLVAKAIIEQEEAEAKAS